MNAENFAEWLRKQGQKVYRTQSSYWVEAGPRVLQAFPYHWIVNPTQQEIDQLLLKTGSLALRYSTSLQAAQGKISYHVVLTNRNFGLSSLRRQARQNVQRGLDYAKIEPIPLTRLAEEGWPLRSDTLARQGRVDAENSTWWKKLCLSANDLPGFEAWGAIHEGQLVASFLGFQCDDTYSFLYEQSSSAHLEARVNNAIYFGATQQVLQRSKVNSLFFGLNSLDAPSSIDEFKFRMGYISKPVRQRVVFHPWINPLANRQLHSLINIFLKRRPGNYFLAKTDGMLRFHCQGMIPLENQDWPECLLDQKTEIFDHANNKNSLYLQKSPKEENELI